MIGLGLWSSMPLSLSRYLPYSSVALPNTLGIHVGIGEGGIIVTFWSAWNVMLLKTSEI